MDQRRLCNTRVGEFVGPQSHTLHHVQPRTDELRRHLGDLRTDPDFETERIALFLRMSRQKYAVPKVPG